MAVRERLFQIVEGTRTLIGLLPIGRGLCTLFVSATPDEWADIQEGEFKSWRDGILRLCPRAEEVFEAVSSGQDLRFTDYRRVRMRSWHDERTIFLGDAAHAMSPHLGQGVNLALLDAESFALSLAATNDFQAACRLHEASRRRHIAFYSRLTYLLSPFFQSGNFILGIGRDVGLPLMGRIPFVRKQMALAMGGVSNGLFSAPMEIGDLLQERRAGAHIPS